jgi:hypothetical protein
MQNPALKPTKTQKCQLHGRVSRGAVTAAAKARCATANFRTGEYTKAETDKAGRSRSILRVLEDAAHLLGHPNRLP